MSVEPDDRPLKGGIYSLEVKWVERYDFLHERGYVLRPRYRPGWSPPWDPKSFWRMHEQSIKIDVSGTSTLDDTRH